MKVPHFLIAVAALGVGVPVSSSPVNTNTKPAKVSYAGYKVYRVSFDSSAAEVDTYLDSLSAIELQRHRQSGEKLAVDLAVAPKDIPAFEASDLTSTILSHDLEADFTAEVSVTSSYEAKKAPGALPNISWFNAYHAYADHIKYWADLQAAFPQNSELIVAGKSFEGRPIQGIHLWGSGGKGSKPAIFFNGNVHAREWITSKVGALLIKPCRRES
jgi:hypothetical protein